MFLKGKRAYLAGPIEACNEKVNWRIDVSKTLTERFGIDVFDPFADPKQQWVKPLNEARSQKDYDTMTRIARGFVRKDLCMVDRADFLIASVPHGVPTCGTHHEIFNSCNAKKPVMLVCEQGKQMAALWLYGVIPHHVIFGSWQDLYNYLQDVDDGKHRDNNRWHFVYGMV